MTTLAELRSALRTLLNDNAVGGYLWSDAALNFHINGAVQSYGRMFPREIGATLATVAGQAEYDLPADCTKVIRVVASEFASGALTEGGDAFGEGYEVHGGKLVLMPAPSEPGLSVVIRYLAPHAPLASDGDVSTVPPADEDMLLASAAAWAVRSLATDDAKRQRFEGRTGLPAIAAAGLYWKQYEDGVRGRRSGVRARRLVAR